MGLPIITSPVNSFNPCTVIVCYAIIFIMSAQGNLNDSIVLEGCDGPTEELLGNLMTGGEKEPLLSKFSCGGRPCDSVILHHGSANDGSHPSSQRMMEKPLPIAKKDCVTLNDDLGSTQQQLRTSTPVLEKLGHSDRLKDKPFQNVFTALPLLAPTSKQIRNEVCRKQSQIFVHHLMRYKFWALQMYDSSAKLPSGILRGNVNQLGDFDQCLAVGKHEAPGIDGKYCLASVDVESTTLKTNDADSLEKAVQLAQSYGLIRSSYRDPGHFIPRFTTIKWALCVPASCSSADVHQTLMEALRNYNETIGLIFDVHVDPEMCYVKQKPGSPLGAPTVFTLIFFATVIGIAAVATFTDTRRSMRHRIQQGLLERIFLAFSVRKNVNELLAEVPDEGDINCIYGVRAVCTVALYLAHKVITLAFSPYSNRVTLTEVSNESWTTIFRASLVYTDSFLLMSGVLTSFNISKEIERKKRIDWIKTFVARFIRLTPALLAVVLFYAYILEHLGTGPQWNLTVKRNADFCKESLWRNILYIQNFFPFEQMCATHTHQLALDMQLSLFSPLIVTLLWHWRSCGVLVLLCLHALSAMLRYLATLHNQLSLVIFHGMTVRQLYQTANLTYSLSLHRATPYLLGVGLGYVLRKTGKNFRIPKMVVWLGWLLAIFFVYLSVFSPANLGLRNYEYNVYDASVYAAFSPIVWSLALGWLIWACSTGYGGLLNNFLCCKSLVVFSRISYAVYLTQFAVFFYNVGSIRSSQQFSLLRSVDIAEVLMVLIASIFVTLLFDLPMQEIKYILMGRGKRRTKMG